ncbi:MAG: hypothetical protein K0R39_4094 [Symbiobacteriaceae bacterium]|nr:hypothetical protein [Symbiobacteriaceae bacterium]
MGCASAAPAASTLRPAEARQQLLHDARVAQWYAGHSAPAVLGTLAPREARRWRKYQPAITFDLAKEGYLVKLEAAVGPAPRRLEALVDRATGAILTLRER